MGWLEGVDVSLFRFINVSLSNPLLDYVMPLFASNVLLAPGLLILGLFLVWKGRVKGVVCLLMLLLAVGIGDWVCNQVKHAIARPRPFLELADARVLIGRGSSFSMPSSHASNWFAALMVGLIYYRPSLWFMLPAASLMAFSRVYNGVHYPSDVLIGAVLGAGTAVAVVWSVAGVWQWVGRRWFPRWWTRCPSLLQPSLATEPSEEGESPPSPHNPGAVLDAQWLRLGYLLIGVVLFARLFYLSGNTIELTGDEAYQWVWSKHLALSYFSKPPLIAYTQRLGTAIWGDTALGVRFFSPVISAALSMVLLRFLAREVNARAGFFLVLIVTATPLLAVGSILMTVDPLSVLFWTLAMISGWKAVQPASKASDWLWTGLWMGLGFLSKYTALFQWLCWLVFFVMWAPARQHLKRPGPYLALLINLLCTIPVLVWNAQHGWPTLSHLASNAKLEQQWHPTLRFFVEFVGTELGLLNPIFFIATLAACIGFCRRGRKNPRLVYFFSMGAPLFLCYLLWSFHSRILPNWIAPSVVPLFCLMVAYWDPLIRLGNTKARVWLFTGLGIGLFIVVLGHDTRLIKNFTGFGLPVKLDPLRRARGWKEMARITGAARAELLAEGKPVFLIGSHYSVAGELCFYLPEAKADPRSNPLVYCRTSSRPYNQFYFWPGYTGRKGENALFVREVKRDPKAEPAAPELLAEFESVTDLGIREVSVHGQVQRYVQLYACRNLR